jgi:hypothetical protein
VYHDDLHTTHRSKHKRNLRNLSKIKKTGPNKGKNWPKKGDINYILIIKLGYISNQKELLKIIIIKKTLDLQSTTRGQHIPFYV